MAVQPPEQYLVLPIVMLSGIEGEEMKQKKLYRVKKDFKNHWYMQWRPNQEQTFLMTCTTIIVTEQNFQFNVAK